MQQVSVLSLSRLSVAALAEFAEEVERLGFDSLWLADERFFREVYASLTYCATRTRQLKLGVGVTDPYTRHPALTAMAIATLDEISGGRAILGLGAGVAGFAEMGLARPKPARALREAMQVIRPLLRGETVTLEGEVITFRGGKLDFQAQRPDVPIYLASNNRLGLQVGGELADGVIMQGAVSPSTLDFFLGNVATGESKGGRTSASQRVARINVSLSSNRRKALDALKLGIVVSLIAQQPVFWSFEHAGLDVPAELKARISGLPYTHDPAIIKPIAELIPDAWVDALTIAGDADRVISEIDRLRERGITEFMLYPVPAEGPPIDTVRAFARDVLPSVRRMLRTAPAT